MSNGVEPRGIPGKSLRDQKDRAVPGLSVSVLSDLASRHMANLPIPLASDFSFEEYRSAAGFFSPLDREWIGNCRRQEGI